MFRLRRFTAAFGIAVAIVIVSMTAPQRADANPKTVEAKPKTVEAKPKTVKAKPKTVEAKPKTVEAKPKTVEAKPKMGNSKPQTVAANPQTSADVNIVYSNNALDEQSRYPVEMWLRRIRFRGREGNSVFIELPNELIEQLQQGLFPFFLADLGTALHQEMGIESLRIYGNTGSNGDMTQAVSGSTVAIWGNTGGNGDMTQDVPDFPGSGMFNTTDGTPSFYEWLNQARGADSTRRGSNILDSLKDQSMSPDEINRYFASRRSRAQGIVDDGLPKAGPSGDPSRGSPWEGLMDAGTDAFNKFTNRLSRVGVAAAAIAGIKGHSKIATAIGVGLAGFDVGTLIGETIDDGITSALGKPLGVIIADATLKKDNSDPKSGNTSQTTGNTSQTTDNTSQTTDNMSQTTTSQTTMSQTTGNTGQNSDNNKGSENEKTSNTEKKEECRDPEYLSPREAIALFYLIFPELKGTEFDPYADFFNRDKAGNGPENVNPDPDKVTSKDAPKGEPKPHIAEQLVGPPEPDHWVRSRSDSKAVNVRYGKQIEFEIKANPDPDARPPGANPSSPRPKPMPIDETFLADLEMFSQELGYENLDALAADLGYEDVETFIEELGYDSKSGR